MLSSLLVTPKMPVFDNISSFVLHLQQQPLNPLNIWIYDCLIKLYYLATLKHLVGFKSEMKCVKALQISYFNLFQLIQP